eukprot:298344-Pelagomonas_calceolata.AAC.2
MACHIYPPASLPPPTAVKQPALMSSPSWLTQERKPSADAICALHHNRRQAAALTCALAALTPGQDLGTTHKQALLEACWGCACSPGAPALRARFPARAPPHGTGCHRGGARMQAASLLQPGGTSGSMRGPSHPPATFTCTICIACVLGSTMGKRGLTLQHGLG